MKYIYNKLIGVLLIAFMMPLFGFAQASSSTTLSYKVNAVMPYVLVTKEKLEQAETLSDLDAHFKSGWVKSYLSVEILAIHQGQTKQETSQGFMLTPKQKELMKLADVGSEILVDIQYIPDNTLKHNDPKTFDFSFTVAPVKEANYIGGTAALNQHLKEKAIDKLPVDAFKNYDLAAVKFTINEEGQVINAHLFESVYQNYKHKAVNDLLLEAVRTMPCWQAAEYVNGTKTKQDFVLAVGNMESCVVNLLDIRRLE